MKQTDPDSATVPLDLDYLDRNYIKLGCEDVLFDVVNIFLETAPEKVALMKDALETADGPELSKLAHGLKGESGSVGARIVASLAAAQDQSARRGDIEEFRSRMPQLELELDRAIALLKQEFCK